MNLHLSPIHTLTKAAPGSWSLHAADKIGPTGVLLSVDLLELNDGTVSSIENNKACQFHLIQGDFCTIDVKEQIIDILAANDRILTSQCNPKSSADKNHENDRLDSILDRGANNVNLSLSCRVDCIISDMAANFTGDKSSDALRTMNLCEDALMFAAGSTCFDDHYEGEGRNECNTIKNNGRQQYDWQQFGLLRIGGTFLCKFFACGQENEKELKTAAKRYFDHHFVIKPPASRKESAELYLYATGFKGTDQFRKYLSLNK